MLSECRIVKRVEVLPENAAINVQWADQIMRDGVVVSETYHRKAYTAEQRREFEAEVAGAAPYVAAVGW